MEALQKLIDYCNKEIKTAGKERKETLKDILKQIPVFEQESRNEYLNSLLSEQKSKHETPVIIF